MQRIRVICAIRGRLRVPFVGDINSSSNEIIMRIRSYSKQELALLYFPDSDPRTATNHLMRWINRNPTLQQELRATGYYNHSKYFTTRQVCAILDYLGEP